MTEEEKIAQKQAEQDAFAAEAAQKAVAQEGGINVKEFEDVETTIHGI
ncbi:MAG: hypothetical protein HFJ65_08160 [Eggerthellaceae bacterium]|nr:hypothetical protein [Eggerthellaceae bacterium]